MSYLTDYSAAIQKLGEERRKKDDEAYEQAVLMTEEDESSIASLTDSDLLTYLMSWYSSSDPRMVQHNQRLREYAKSVALNRMNRGER